MSTGLPDAVAKILLGDVGGTNTRLAIFDRASGEIEHERKIPTAQHFGLIDAVEGYVRDVGIQPDGASVAVATPVYGDRIRLTNSDWSFSQAGAKHHFNWDWLRVCNDFEALALAVPTLTDDELVQIGGNDPGDGNKAVIGPGTGLGVAGLVAHESGWIPLPGEGGHVTLAARNRIEAELIALARKHDEHISAEDLISGRGLVNLHEAVCERFDEPFDIDNAAAVFDAAQSSSAAAVSVATFFRLLGTVAANLCLTLNANGGVYIGGGIVRTHLETFENSDFRQRFNSRGRYSEFLSQVPCYVINARHLALRGLAAEIPRFT